MTDIDDDMLNRAILPKWRGLPLVTEISWSGTMS